MKRITDIKRVITPIDFSENAPLIAESAAYVAGTFKAELNLIFVVQDFTDYSGFFVPQMNAPDLVQELFTSAQERMDKFCQDNEESFKALGVTALSSKVLMGDVAEQIIDYAINKQGNLIVMGTHGYKGLEKIMFGSIADKVVKAAPCPIMTVNPYTCCQAQE
ncbi:MAG: universal stress protein [Proteobacteria bacterium]|nr:universal stress protein [Pseudomonadota bacterium]MBU1648624.1 universal stress protein [Pseudomonadota bacterium]MBU1985928.1 universal stress protein [Pseudomonadota bacterium]